VQWAARWRCCCRCCFSTPAPPANAVSGVWRAFAARLAAQQPARGSQRWDLLRRRLSAAPALHPPPQPTWQLLPRASQLHDPSACRGCHCACRPRMTSRQAGACRRSGVGCRAPGTGESSPCWRWPRTARSTHLRAEGSGGGRQHGRGSDAGPAMSHLVQGCSSGIAGLPPQLCILTAFACRWVDEDAGVAGDVGRWRSRELCMVGGRRPAFECTRRSACSGRV
jgi:hypothetical protein